MQLVFIARALASEPKILFLDEPESHLDFKKQLIILDVIEKLAHEDKLICVINTHFPNHALRIANKVLMLNYGSTHCFGTTKEILTVENIRNYFGVETHLFTIPGSKQDFESIYPLSISNVAPSNLIKEN